MDFLWISLLFRCMKSFFSTLMRGLSMMTSLHKVEWTIKSGTPRSYDYLIELKRGEIWDYCILGYVDRITSAEERRKKSINCHLWRICKIEIGRKNQSFLRHSFLRRL